MEKLELIYQDAQNAVEMILNLFDTAKNIYNLSIGIFPQEIQNILTAFLVILIALLAFSAFGVIKGES